MGFEGFGESRDKVGGLYAVTHVGLQEIILHPFGEGNLTKDGQQFSTPSTTATAANAYATVGPATAWPPVLGDMVELEVGLTSAIRQDATAPSTVQWMWQARNLNPDGTVIATGLAWRNLMAAYDSTVTESTAYVENTYSGRINLNNTLDRLPFEIQLVVLRNDTTGRLGIGKAKNSSYIKVVTSSLYKRALD